MSYTAWSVVFGEQPTAAKWNQLGQNDAGFKDGTNIDDDAIIARHISGFDKSNLTTDSNPYKFSAYCSTGKTITNTSLIVDLQTEIFDTNNNFSGSRYTAPVSGFYQINAQAWMGAFGAGSSEFGSIAIRKNGSATGMPESERMNGSDNANRFIRPKIGSLIQLTAGDYIELWATFTGSRDIVAGISQTYMNGFLVSRT